MSKNEWVNAYDYLSWLYDRIPTEDEIRDYIADANDRSYEEIRDLMDRGDLDVLEDGTIVLKDNTEDEDEDDLPS